VILVKCNTVKRWRVTAGRTHGEGSGQGIFQTYDVAIGLRFDRASNGTSMLAS